MYFITLLVDKYPYSLRLSGYNLYTERDNRTTNQLTKGQPMTQINTVRKAVLENEYINLSSAEARGIAKLLLMNIYREVTHGYEHFCLYGDGVTLDLRHEGNYIVMSGDNTPPTILCHIDSLERVGY